ncbi:MFS transporter [Paradevosia shaoguanensis]|uniref:MFS transporter n=1 Tax=Paradevosia shaoguanensis TaxID=1335043 RepID=UPI003C7659DC
MLFAFRRNELSPPGVGLPRRERTIAVTAILINVAMANLDSAIANTALPTIARDLQTTDAQSIWVVSAYQIAMVATLLPAAALGEVIGLRRVSMVALVLFTIASLVCGMAPTFQWLVAGRVLQGMSAAGILGLSVAMMRSIYPRELMGAGMGLNALVVGMSFAAGPTAASIILSFASWHWLFLINVPLGILGIVMGLHSLPPTIRGGWRFDRLAALLCGVGLATTIFTLNAVTRGASWPLTIAGAVIAVAAILALLRRQMGSPAPILPVDLLRRPVIALSAISSYLTLNTQALAFISLPFMFQAVLGYSQVETGFLITPWPVFVALTAPFAGRWSDKLPGSLIGSCGLVILAIAMALLATLPAEPSALDIVWRMALCGVGFGLFQSPTMRIVIMASPAERSGGAGGVSSIVGNLGQATGAALVAGLFNLFGSQGAIIALWIGSAFALIASGVSLMRLRHSLAGFFAAEVFRD